MMGIRHVFNLPKNQRRSSSRLSSVLAESCPSGPTTWSRSSSLGARLSCWSATARRPRPLPPDSKTPRPMTPAGPTPPPGSGSRPRPTPAATRHSPRTIQAVALYLGHLAAAGRSMAFIEQARAAISHFHAAAGMQKGDNPAGHPVAAEVVRGWRNRAPAPKHPAPRHTDALTSDALALVREVLRLPRRSRGCLASSILACPWRQRNLPSRNASAGPSGKLWTGPEQAGGPIRQLLGNQGKIGGSSVGGWCDRHFRHHLFGVNYFCRLASIILAGSPPYPDPAVEPLRSGSWGRRIPG